MNIYIRCLVSILICCMLSACKPSVNLDSDLKKFSYSYGAIIGTDLKNQELKIDMLALKAGIEDSYNEKEMKIPFEEAKQLYKQFQTKRFEKFKLKEQAIVKKNVEEGNEFLARNSHKKDIVVLENGLQYKIIKEGTGATPKDNQIVSIHFIDSFPDGSEFYNTYEKFSPVQFQIGSVPKGWTQALKMMKEGAIWELYLPGKLAYEDKPVPNQGPYKTIITRIELIKIDD